MYAAVIVLLPSLLWADAKSLVRHSPPFNWMDAVRPESEPKVDFPEYADALDRAGMLLSAGRYRAALYALHGETPRDAVRASLIRVEALSALGRSDEAMRVLSEVGPASVPVQLARARLLLDSDRAADAIALLRELVEANPQHLVARFELGRALEYAGEIDAAKEAFAWFVEGPTDYLSKWKQGGAGKWEGAEELTAVARGIDRWAVLHGKYREVQSLNDTVLAMLSAAYDEVDRGYWPARLAVAEFYLAHNNSKEAVKEVRAALASNPRDARALDLMGKIALEAYNFDGADEAISALREVDPNSVVADLLEARNLLLQRRPWDAEMPLNRVLSRQPRRVEALALLASARSLQLRDDEAKALLAEIEQIDPGNASAYFELAEQLSAMRQYPRAEAMYRVAIERAPWWTLPRNGLGLLLTQSGDEDEARVVLRDAYELDPYNARTLNYLTLLDQLAEFERIETEHFIILFNKEKDPIIGEVFAERLEEMHADVVTAFKHKPAVKTIVEVFPTHAGFSVRTTGAPWIGTVGASTGRVIALVAPRREGKTLGPFNWLQVMRHEYVHTVTLSMTENRVPHWMTEGLAVLEERTPMRWDWVPMLHHAVTKDELFTMEGLTWGFVRPRRPNDRQLAYAQSFWTCHFIEERWGRDAILAMLEHFRAGKTESQVLRDVLKIEPDSFYRDFVAWTKQQVAGWGYDDETSLKFKQLRERGEALIKQRKYAEAIEVWNEARKLRPVDALPHQRLAGLYLSREVNQPDKALEHLRTLNAAELKDNRYAKRMARLLRDTGKLDEARGVLEQAVLIEPYDVEAHRLLRDVGIQLDDAKLVERQDRLIATIEPWRQKLKDSERMPDAPPVGE
jgi:tetratricopeptide (TPR) repeat protein